MKTLRLVVEHSDETIHPMHEFVCESAAVDREIFLEGQVHDGVETVLTYVEGDPTAYKEAISALDPDDYDITTDEDGGFFCHARLELGETGRTVRRLRAGHHRDRLARRVPRGPDHAPDRRRPPRRPPGDARRDPEGASVDVRSIDEYAAAVGGSVTDRQRAALRAAWEAGFYEVPRETGIEAVADELDAAVSTVSTLLRRAESNLVADALDRHR